MRGQIRAELRLPPSPPATTISVADGYGSQPPRRRHAISELRSRLAGETLSVRCTVAKEKKKESDLESACRRAERQRERKCIEFRGPHMWMSGCLGKNERFALI